MNGRRVIEPVAWAVYGDFNCPFSAVASDRASELERRGLADIDWRAVEHDPTIAPGDLDSGDRDEVDRELADVRKLLIPGERDRLRLPAVRLNSRLANETYSAANPRDRSTIRTRLFAAHWQDGLDLNDGPVIAAIAGERSDPDLAARWNAEWAVLPRPMVPVIVLADGSVSRGLGALVRMARMLVGSDCQP
jgi:hypothetical protein